MPPRTFSDLIVDYLEQMGVKYVFGIPGGHISSLYEALARSARREGPRAILARHETGAAAMADGYARETGTLGVCCATTGPGATNLITGVAAAYADQIPLLVITAQTSLAHFGRGAFQESSPDTIDTVGMLHYCTRYNSLVTHPQQLERKLLTAITTAYQTPSGPAHLSIPVDLLRLPVAPATFPQLRQPANSSYVDLAALEELWQILQQVLQQGQRVVFFIGRDCRGATQEIITCAELIKAPIITTQEGKTWVNPYHPLARGVFGFAGHLTARQALLEESVGLILAVGTTLSQWETSGWDAAVLNHKLVHLHSVASYFTSSPMARLHVQGTIKTLLQTLVMRLQASLKELPPPFPTWQPPFPCAPPQIEVNHPTDYATENTPLIKPPRLLCELRNYLPPQTRFIVDTSNWLAWTIHYWFSPFPENYRLAIGTAAMGWGIGSAVGTALAIAPTPVVCLTGDGCFLMHGQEITVAVTERLPVIFVILNDQSYGMVKHRHRQTGGEPLEFALPPVDFSLMAKAVGAQGYTIRCPADLKNLDYDAISVHPGPTVLDVQIDPEEVPPLGMV